MNRRQLFTMAAAVPLMPLAIEPKANAAVAPQAINQTIVLNGTMTPEQARELAGILRERNSELEQRIYTNFRRGAIPYK